MLRAAIRGLENGAAGGPAGVLAVTVLTSLDRSDLDATGIKGDVHDQVMRLGRLAAATGAEGVICSPAEVPILKGISPSLVAVTPGIRTRGDVTNDQKRVATPVEALELGADYLVIGRSITGHGNPEIAAERIAAAIETYRDGSLEAELGE